MAIDALKEDSVIIFISGLNLIDSPDPVQEAMASEEAFGPTPIIAVFDAKVEESLGVVPYFDMKSVDGFDKVKGALVELRGEDAAPAPMIRHQPEMWKDVRGRSLKATFVNSIGSEVTLRLANGKLATIELSRLSAESQARIAELTKKE